MKWTRPSERIISYCNAWRPGNKTIHLHSSPNWSTLEISLPLLTYYTPHITLSSWSVYPYHVLEVVSCLTLNAVWMVTGCWAVHLQPAPQSEMHFKIDSYIHTWVLCCKKSHQFNRITNFQELPPQGYAQAANCLWVPLQTASSVSHMAEMPSLWGASWRWTA